MRKLIKLGSGKGWGDGKGWFQNTTGHYKDGTLGGRDVSYSIGPTFIRVGKKPATISVPLNSVRVVFNWPEYYDIGHNLIRTPVNDYTEWSCRYTHPTSGLGANRSGYPKIEERPMDNDEIKTVFNNLLRELEDFDYREVRIPLSLSILDPRKRKRESLRFNESIPRLTFSFLDPKRRKRKEYVMKALKRMRKAVLEEQALEAAE